MANKRKIIRITSGKRNLTLGREEKELKLVGFWNNIEIIRYFCNFHPLLAAFHGK